MHFLEAFQRAAQSCRHHLGVFSNIAIPVGVRMRGFEEKYVASIHVPAFHLAKRRERSLLPYLSPVTLAVAKCEMALLAAREIASRLGLEEWRQGSPAVVLGSVPCAEASSYTRF